MFSYNIQPIDSVVFGRNVVSLSVANHDVMADFDFNAWETNLISEYYPCYIYAKIPVEDIEIIQYLESFGYYFVETQIRSKKRLTYTEISSNDYELRKVQDDFEFNQVIDIAKSTFTDDRISIDRKLPATISGMRYTEYVKNSLKAEDEEVLCLIERSSGLVVAFKTHKLLASKQVLFLLGGVRNDLKNLGLGPLANMLEFNYLLSHGYQEGITHISARNYSVLNLEIGKMRFKVIRVFVVLRKIL